MKRKRDLERELEQLKEEKRTMQERGDSCQEDGRCNVKWINRLARTMEEARFADYVQYLDNTRKVLRTNFLAGLSRGLGMAIGFSLLGALAIWLLQALAASNLPGIGNFIARIVEIVNEQTVK